MVDVNKAKAAALLERNEEIEKEGSGENHRGQKNRRGAS